MTDLKGSVRCNALDMQGLAAQERHGKRLDRTSKKRVVRDAEALRFDGKKGLDLRARYDEHMAGVRLSAGAKKPILHFIVRFPPELLEGPEVGKFVGDKKARQKEMLLQAAAFISQTHGYQAVFAGRLDRDEEGETVVDIFACPKYEKTTKRKPEGTGQIWASATRFGKALAEKHAPEIRRRLKDADNTKKLTSPRAVGMALQSEFAAYFKAINGVPLAPKTEKTSATPDRIEIEAYKELSRQQKALEAEKAQVAQQQQDLEADRQLVKTGKLETEGLQDQLASEIKDAREDRKAAALALQQAQADAAVAAQARAEAEALRDTRTEALQEVEQDREAISAQQKAVETGKVENEQLLAQLTDALAEVQQFRSHIQRLADLVIGLITPVAEALGVAPKLAAVEDALREAQALPEPRPAAPSMMSLLKKMPAKLRAAKDGPDGAVEPDEPGR